MKLIILFLFLILLMFLKFKENFEDNEKLPKRIFTYSFNKSHKLNIEKYRILIPAYWEIVIIDEENMDKYVDNDFIKKYKNLEKEKFIYLICIKALANNGGVFIDPKINLNDGSIFDRYQIENMYEGYDSSLIELDANKYIKYQKSYIIMGPKDSTFLNNLVVNLSKNFTTEINIFINKIIPKNITIKNFPTTKSETMFMLFFTIYLLLKEKNKYQINSKKELNKKIYGIKLSTASKRDMLNKNFLNYIFSKPFFD